MKIEGQRHQKPHFLHRQHLQKPGNASHIKAPTWFSLSYDSYYESHLVIFLLLHENHHTGWNFNFNMKKPPSGDFQTRPQKFCFDRPLASNHFPVQCLNFILLMLCSTSKKCCQSTGERITRCTSSHNFSTRILCPTYRVCFTVFWIDLHPKKSSHGLQGYQNC
jgi:hypothetical protein